MISDKDKLFIKAAVERGDSQSWIAKELGCNRSTVESELHRFRVNGVYIPKMTGWAVSSFRPIKPTEQRAALNTGGGSVACKLEELEKRVESLAQHMEILISIMEKKQGD